LRGDQRAGGERASFVDRIARASLDDIREDPELFNFAMAGRPPFQTNCVQCHGAGGAGSTGYPQPRRRRLALGRQHRPHLRHHRARHPQQRRQDPRLSRCRASASMGC
jgi:mono/diheme cytochrome c family protein